MAACTECNVCESPGRMGGAIEVGRVPCNVRRFQDRLFTLWRCTGCASIHCAEDVDLAHYYAQYPLKYQRLTVSERIGYGNRIRLLERHGFARSQRILDYGCGAGLFVDFLRERGVSQAFGYDAFVEQYQSPHRLRETYDAVTAYDVVEHYDDPRQFMREVVPLLRSGGLLAVGTPNADHVSIARIGDPSLHPPYHRHILSEKALLALGREHGLDPVHVHPRSFYDSLVPTVNSRFMWSYVRACDGLLDSAVEPPRVGLVLRSPELVFKAFFGYFLPLRDNILVTFRKPPVSR